MWTLSRQIGRLAISALLAAGFAEHNSGLCAIAFKLAPKDAGAAPASNGASLKAIAPNPELRQANPTVSRAEAPGRDRQNPHRECSIQTGTVRHQLFSTWHLATS